MTDERPIPTPTQSPEVTIISDVAQQRRLAAQPSIDKKTPGWLLEIAQTEVSYTLSPRAHPLRQIDFPTLRDSLAKQYNISLKTPDDLGVLTAHLPAGTKLTETDIVAMMLSGNNPMLMFTNGRFPVSRNDFVELKSILLTDELIYVVVQGKSQIAELVAKEVAELVWRAAGGDKRWDDIEPGLRLVSYGTGTIVDLGFAAETLMSPLLVKFMDDQVIGGKKYAAEMGQHSYRHKFKASPTRTSMYTLDELHLLIHGFDATTGKVTTTRLKFSISERESQGTGIVYVASELPFETHIECVGMLIESFRKNGAKSR
jgi:hypothetical protein